MATGYLLPISTILQFFTDQGVVLAGGKVYTYVAGTTTPVATYTSSSLSVLQANPIILQSNGRMASPVWVPADVTVKMVLQDSSGNVISGGTIDNLQGINDPSYLYPQTSSEIAAGVTPTNYLYPLGNVLRYGADSTGATTCQTAVQNAFNAVGSGGTVTFPSGSTFLFNITSVGGQITISNPVNVVATGATFNITATVQPNSAGAPISQERINQLFQVSRVSGFSWVGGTVNGGRTNAVDPYAGFIGCFGCSNVLIDNVLINNMDHNFGAITFDAVLIDGVTNVAQENIKVTRCGFTRCYYGIYTHGTVNGLVYENNWGRDFDLTDGINGSSHNGATQYAAAFSVYGFDAVATSATGNQRGIRIVNNEVDGSTQGFVAYNYASNTYTSSSTYECEDIVVANNIFRRVLGGCNINGWNQAEVIGNSIERLALSSTSGYVGVAAITTTAGYFGAGIEISTAGRKLSAVGNNILSFWPLTNTTDLSGGFTGIAFGATGNTTDTSTTALVSANIITSCYWGLQGTGNVTAHISANRIDSCYRALANNTTPLNGGTWPEGVVEGNTFRFASYYGTPVGTYLYGAWRITNNQFVGDPSNAFAYLLVVLPGSSAPTFIKGNVFSNASEGILITQSGSTTFVDDNDFLSCNLGIEVHKDATSALYVRNNLFSGSTKAIAFSGAGSHGTYFADNNSLPTGYWADDSAAIIPSNLGYRSAYPTTGTWPQGCTFYNTAPTSTGILCWVCTTAGSAGTWTGVTIP